MRLEKWYLDVVSEEGDVLMLYQARLALPHAVLRYSSALHRPRGGEPRTRSSWRGSPPRRDGDEITWSSRPLGLRLVSRARRDPIRRELYRSGEGRLEWRCWQPAADVTVTSAGGVTLSGLGYAEELLLTLPAWALPIDELRWGRFLSETEAIVWIEWRGAEPLRLLFRDGEERADVDIGEEEVSWTDRTGRAALRLEREATLRGGRLGTTLLTTPRLRRLLPGRALGIEETKWLSRGSLGTSRGWAIHEVVRFRRRP